jgi:hypothetical protein
VIDRPEARVATTKNGGIEIEEVFKAGRGVRSSLEVSILKLTVA